MYALWRVVIKEFLQLRQDKKMIPSLIVGPIVQLLALGYAAGANAYITTSFRASGSFAKAWS